MGNLSIFVILLFFSASSWAQMSNNEIICRNKIANNGKSYDDFSDAQRNADFNACMRSLSKSATPKVKRPTAPTSSATNSPSASASPSSAPAEPNECNNQCFGEQCVRHQDGAYRCIEETPPSREESPASEGSTQSSESCLSEFTSLINRCEQEAVEATASCDEKNDAGMNNVAGTASQIALMMGQQTASSIQAACSKMADLSQAANAALAAYRMNCKNAQEACLSACDQAKKFTSEKASACYPHLSSEELSNAMSHYQQVFDKNINTCRSLETKINEAQQAIQNYGVTTANASQCSALTSGDSAVTELCKANPKYPGCSPAAPVDCSKPEVATTNKVCICSKNPHDPACSVSQKAGGDNLVGSIDSSSRLGNKADGSDMSGDLFGTPPISHGTPSSGGGDSIDGSQGGGSVGGGGGGSGGGPAAAGGGIASEDSAGVNGGFYGGGGGRLFGGGSGGDGGAAGVYGGRLAKGTTPGGLDLKKFLPGGQFDPKRGVSGFGGLDGITGPHSNIWQKIQNRYQVMSPTLLP
ncbi:MAG: hypothetical protein KUL82_13570 [Bdellovibrio sp.]|nr:hypothetical protein [Bdellovibrio sp.]